MPTLQKSSKTVFASPSRARRWTGPRCETLTFAPGKETDCGKLCAYHGHGNDTTSWGASVVRADDGRLYMFAAEMTNGCDLGAWRTNSKVVVAVADDPLGPFEYAEDAVAPWAHNPQVTGPSGDQTSRRAAWSGRVPEHPVDASAAFGSEPIRRRRDPSPRNIRAAAAAAPRLVPSRVTVASSGYGTGHNGRRRRSRRRVRRDRAEILLVAPDFATCFKRTTPACQRCKNEQERCSRGRETGRP